MKTAGLGYLLGGLTASAAVAVLSIAMAEAFGGGPTSPPPPEAHDAFRSRVKPLLDRYCIDCHSTESPQSGIVLDTFGDQAAAVRDGRTWLRVRDALEANAMPPADEPQPTLEERAAISGWIEKDYMAAIRDGRQGAAPVVIRRLNRQEYNNTIRDLIGLDLRLADDFPSDEIGHGFDNVGSALNISPAHVEKYIEAAEIAMDRAILPPDAAELPPAELIGLVTHRLPPDKPVEFDHPLKPGLYLADLSLVRVGIAETVPPPRLVVGLGKDRRTLEAVRVQDETVVYRCWLKVSAGDGRVHVSLAPGQEKSENVARPEQIAANVSGDQRYGNDRGLHVDSMVVHGPVRVVAKDLPASHGKILFCTPGDGDESRLDCARRVITRFTERAFRRPPRRDEIERIIRLYRLADERGESFERAVQVALTTVLASPQFLYLAEPDPAGEDRRLTGFELASRLSYFLWSSMPDEDLFRDAREGTLHANLRCQVARMLADPRSDAFVENFAGQWLQLRKMAGVTPDRELFPGFDDVMRESMREETEQYFGHVVRGNRSVLELLDSDYTFLNERLARHYGIEGVRGDEFRKVALGDRRRGGVLTQASVLTLTSNPNRTSPVKRGQWILQQILGTPPPPPPPDVPKLDDSRHAASEGTVRDRLEAHRARAECASCHRQMDPLGFALENYDAVGRWRTKDGPFPVDTSGELAGGRKFADAQQLKQILRTTAGRKFARCLVKNLFTYGLGRGLEAADHARIEEITDKAADEDYRLHSILFGIVESRAFQHRGVARSL
ncbi:MAG: DUF1592 domain-containing protein [Isosphaeraceae bacterium]